jgi:phosphoribosylformylglycinamidine synthase
MDLKEPGNLLFLVGATRDEMGGSHHNLVCALSGGEAPAVDGGLAPRVFRGLHESMRRGLVRACHDLSEGGLAAALAEMAFAGEVGADVAALPAGLSDAVALFSESTTRFVVEVRPGQEADLRACLADVPLLRLGTTVKEQRLRVVGASGAWVVWTQLAELKEAWQKPLRW